VVFACGTTLPLWSRGEAGAMGWGHLLGWGCFALLCCLNTLSIECWEGGARGKRFGLERGRLNWLIGGVTAGAFVVLVVSAALGGAGLELPAVALGAALLLVLHVARKRFSAEALRVLADAALLVPPIVVLLVGVRW
jgi:hypothetical protein